MFQSIDARELDSRGIFGPVSPIYMQVLLLVAVQVPYHEGGQDPSSCPPITQGSERAPVTAIRGNKQTRFYCCSICISLPLARAAWKIDPWVTPDQFFSKSV